MQLRQEAGSGRAAGLDELLWQIVTVQLVAQLPTKLMVAAELSAALLQSLAAPAVMCCRLHLW